MHIHMLYGASDITGLAARACDNATSFSLGSLGFYKGMRVFSFLKASTVIILTAFNLVNCLTKLSVSLPLYCSNHMSGGLG